MNENAKPFTLINAAELPKQGDNVAATEAKPGETITPPGLSEPMKKEKETAQKQSAIDKQSPKKQNESAAARQNGAESQNREKSCAGETGYPRGTGCGQKTGRGPENAKAALA